MLGQLLLQTTLPGEPGTTDEPGTLSNLVSTMWDNLGNNGYQTGTALIFATVAIVALINIKAKAYVMIPVAIGAFWAGWLAYNTFTRQSNPLFPGDVQALELWDIAFQNDKAFLAVVIVACAAAALVWRKSVVRARQGRDRGRSHPGRVVRLQRRAIGSLHLTGAASRHQGPRTRRGTTSVRRPANRPARRVGFRRCRPGSARRAAPARWSRPGSSR